VKTSRDYLGKYGDKKRKLCRTARIKIEGKNGRRMCCRITHQCHLIEETKKWQKIKKNIIIATAIVMGTQLIKDCEYSEISSSDSEIEELLKVSYCSLRLVMYIIINLCKMLYITIFDYYRNSLKGRKYSVLRDILRELYQIIQIANSNLTFGLHVPHLKFYWQFLVQT